MISGKKENGEEHEKERKYIKKGGNIKTFNMLNQRQLSPVYKKKISDYTINNNYSLVYNNAGNCFFINNLEIIKLVKLDKDNIQTYILKQIEYIKRIFIINEDNVIKKLN